MCKKAPTTLEEQKIMDLLDEAYNLFCRLEMTYPYHAADFSKAIDALHDIIGHRVLQREYPGSYPA